MDEVKVYPGLNGKVTRVFKHQQFRYLEEEYKGSRDPKFDFALIKLKEKVPDFDKKNQLFLGVNFEDTQASLCIFGYPGKGNYKYNKNQDIVEGFQKGFEKKKIKAYRGPHNLVCHQYGFGTKRVPNNYRRT